MAVPDGQRKARRHQEPRGLALPLQLSVLLLVITQTHAQPVRGLNYSPFAFNSTRFCLTSGEVARDLALIASHTTDLRLFGVAACLAATHQILAASAGLGLRVMLGLWISQDAAGNEQELSALPYLLHQYRGVISSVAVGNEAVSFLNVAPEVVLSAITRVRAMAPGIPLTSVEVVWLWDSLSDPSSYARRLLQQVDLVAVNIHPYYEGLPVSCAGLNILGCYDAATWTINRALNLRQAVGKPVVVTETGLPTDGQRCCNTRPYGFPSSAPLFLSQPSIANAAAFLTAFSNQAAAAGMPFYWFELADADWKRIYSPCSFCATVDACPCTFEYHWGLYTSDRVAKPGLPLHLLTRPASPPLPPISPNSTLPSPLTPSPLPPPSPSPPLRPPSPSPPLRPPSPSPPLRPPSPSPPLRPPLPSPPFRPPSPSTPFRPPSPSLPLSHPSPAPPLPTPLPTPGPLPPPSPPAALRPPSPTPTLLPPSPTPPLPVRPSPPRRRPSPQPQLAGLQPTARPPPPPPPPPALSLPPARWPPNPPPPYPPQLPPSWPNSSTVVGGTRYQLSSTPMDFNQLAAHRQGCPPGATFASFTGQDRQAALLLAPGVAIWVNEDTQGGLAPFKSSRDELQYQPTRPLLYICKQEVATSGSASR